MKTIWRDEFKQASDTSNTTSPQQAAKRARLDTSSSNHFFDDLFVDVPTTTNDLDELDRYFL